MERICPAALKLTCKYRGKVFVYTGILPICADDNGLAAVLSHEIAHNVAHHMGEQISKQRLVFLPIALGLGFLLDVSGGIAQLLTSFLLELPASRTLEEEADHIGLFMMAESCYDPQGAVELYVPITFALSLSICQRKRNSTNPPSAGPAWKNKNM